MNLVELFRSLTLSAHPRIRICVRFALCLLVLFCSYIRDLCLSYNVSPIDAVSSACHEASLTAIGVGAALIDTSDIKHCDTGPDSLSNSFSRFDDVILESEPVCLSQLAVNRSRLSNEKIVRSRYEFGYQTSEEPKLHQLRQKYRLKNVVEDAKDEFDAQVQLRNWTRSQFKRSDFQPCMSDFDALLVLDRNLRNHGETYSPRLHIDPCKFFPMLYGQVLLCMGYQARLVSVSHGMVEVWSNQHKKWVLMDAELNHHFEKDGVPLNLVDLSEAGKDGTESAIQLVRGEQSSDPNTTMVHLKLEKLSVGAVIQWLTEYPIEIVDLRNDWMTNHYFRGHPKRSEQNSLSYYSPQIHPEFAFRRRLRQVTHDIQEFNWSLNQTEIWLERPSTKILRLGLRTVTPNFRTFEIIVDDNEALLTKDCIFNWDLHAGRNNLVVRTINDFGVRGIDSFVELNITEHGSELACSKRSDAR